MGRPPSVNEESLRKLEQAFSLGASDRYACLFAGVSTTAFYRYCQENENFRDRKETLKTTPALAALQVIANNIKKGDKAVAQWYLERRMKEDFSPRQEVTGKDGAPIINPYEKMSDEELDREIEKLKCENDQPK